MVYSEGRPANSSYVKLRIGERSAILGLRRLMVRNETPEDALNRIVESLGFEKDKAEELEYKLRILETEFRMKTLVIVGVSLTTVLLGVVFYITKVNF